MSKALTAPDGKIRIPLNEEASQGTGQIEEFLMAYNGEGIQHIALICDDLIAALDALKARGVPFMTAPPATYYEMLEGRLPDHGQPVDDLQARGILLDGTTEGGKPRLLLQIFSETLIGPLFFEFIQRKGDDGFGEGNFKPLRVDGARSAPSRHPQGRARLSGRESPMTSARSTTSRTAVTTPRRRWRFYQDVLDMDLVLAISEDHVPSTKAPDPYMHVFLDAGMGNVLAFFELPNSPPMGRDGNTPDWVQHIAFELGSMEELLAAKAKVEAKGIAVVGRPITTSSSRSTSSTPSGHRLELAVNVDRPGGAREAQRGGPADDRRVGRHQEGAEACGLPARGGVRRLRRAIVPVPSPGASMALPTASTSPAATTSRAPRSPGAP